MRDELPVAERAEACRAILEQRGYLIIRPGPIGAVGEVQEVDSVEDAFRRFREVSDYLGLDVEELADGGLVSFLPEVSDSMRGYCLRTENAYLN